MVAVRGLSRRPLADVSRLLAVLLALVLGCGGGTPRAVNLPPPITVTSLAEGDVFELVIIGEEKLPTAFTVAPDGTVDLPYVKRVRVAGMEPQEVAETVRARLVEQKIFRDPVVTVSVREYNSKTLEILGEVQKPGSYPIQPGMTLVRAITLAGGFNSIADKGRVTIRRTTKDGTVAATVSVEDIMDNRLPDVPLQAGDSINVEQRVF